MLDVKDVLAWDVHNWSEVLPFWNDRLGTLDRSAARILALGEREGGLSVWLASQGFRVLCSDIDGIRPEAMAWHRTFDFADRISYRDVDVFKIPFDDQQFDVVICKSVIGGLKTHRKDPATRTLENQRMAVDEIHRVLKSGGVFLGAENLRGHRILRVAREWYKKGRVGWRHLTRDEIIYLFDSFATVETKCFGVVPGLSRHDLVNRCIHRLNRIVDSVASDDAKYLCGIAARKSPS